jgi:hypothetical protein
MIPDFKSHHFVEDYKPGEPPSAHYCDRCGLKASLMPDGSTVFDDGSEVRISINAGAPLNPSLVSSCAQISRALRPGSRAV